MVLFADIRKKIDIRSYMMIIALIAIWVIFLIFTDGTFLSTRNISNLLRQMATVSILGCGMMFVLLVGEIDLCVGSLVTLTGVVGGALMAWGNWGTLPTILVLLVMGVIVGVINGFATVYMRVPSFITTLGTQMIFSGLVLLIGKGISIAPMADNYLYVGQGFLNSFSSIAIGAVAFVICAYSFINKKKRRLRYGLDVDATSNTIIKIVAVLVAIAVFEWILLDYKNLPFAFFLVIVIVAVLQFLTEKTRFGRSIYAIGGNKFAAYSAGIDVKKFIMICFIITDVAAVIAGIVLTSRLNAGSAVSGDMKELDAIAAAVIGGASLNGGKGRVMGAILGALVMASLDNGMSLLNLNAYWQYLVKGAILIIAVWFDSWAAKNK
jgi:D-xylose transport system permease protein